MRVFASGQGQSAARGTVSGGQPVPSTYASSIVTDKKYDEVHMVISSGTVKEFVADPPTVPSPDRVPVTDAHRRGVSDPMTASLMRVPGNGDTFVPQACPRKISVFDGRMRYDLQLAFKRLDQVKSEKGYQGKVVVCAVDFSPIAGHIPDRAAIKYLAELRDIELWLAPIAGTRLMVPYRPRFQRRSASASCRRPNSSRCHSRAGRARRRSDVQAAAGTAAPRSAPQSPAFPEPAPPLTDRTYAASPAPALLDLVAFAGLATRSGRERIPTLIELAIRARFVPELVPPLKHRAHHRPFPSHCGTIGAWDGHRRLPYERTASPERSRRLVRR